MTNPQPSSKPSRHIAVERAFQIAMGTAKEVDPEERQHMVDCQICGDAVVRIVHEQLHKGDAVRPIGSHIQNHRLRSVAASDTISFTDTEFMHMGTCAECFEVWKEMLEA